jgi:hypothetical protein
VIALLGLVPWRFWAYGAAIITIAAGIGIAINHFESVGAADATAKIEKANQNAQSKFDEGKTDVDRCYSGGGTWDRFNELCNPGPGK